MNYTLQPDERVSEGIKRIIDTKVQRGIEHIGSDTDTHETVHEVRKRYEEFRAAVRPVRPVLQTYKQENLHYWGAAHEYDPAP